MTSRHWLRVALISASLTLVHCAPAGPDSDAHADAREGGTADGTGGDGSDTTPPTDTPVADTGDDTVTTTDTGMPMDVVTPMDVVMPGDTGDDTTVVMDTGTPTDTGTGMDTGTTTDTGTPADTGVSTTDAGACPPGQTRCGAFCVDIHSDEMHCGTCSTACAAGQVCVVGTCMARVSGVVLSEVHHAPTSYLELFNGGNTAIDLTGYLVQWAGDGGSSGAATLPAYSLAPGAFVVLRSGTGAADATSVPLGSALTWTNDLAVRLLSPAGVGVDFVRLGASTTPPPAGTSWTGTNAPSPNATIDQSLVRNVYVPDTDTAADWSLTTPSSPATYCGRPGRCGTTCRDFESDRNNCGGCGITCGTTQICRYGACTTGLAGLWFSEYRTYPVPGVEIHNPTSNVIRINGFRVQVVGGTTQNLFLPDRTIEPGGFLFVYASAGTNDTTSFFAGAAAAPAFTADAAVALFDDAGTGLDYVRFGTSTATIAGTSWFGGSVTATDPNVDQSAKRNLQTLDTDSAADWSITSPSTPGFGCYPGLTACGGTCIALGTNPANCGSCGHVCGAAQSCIAGTCTSTNGVVLSEIRNFAPETFEIFNGTSASVDLSGWTIEWISDGGSGMYVVPGGVSIASGAFLTFDERAGTSTATLQYTSTSIVWNTFIAVWIRNGAGTAVDFVRTGASPTLPPAGTAWSGAGATNPSDTMDQPLVRNVYAADTDTAADWTLGTASTVGAYCVNTLATICGGNCSVVSRDNANCGACGNVCPTGERCSSGQCNGGPVEGDLRLVNGATPNQGRVEIYHGGVWGTVCDDGTEGGGTVSTNDATVVCRQLGYTSGAGMCCAAYGAGTGQIWMDNVACTGSETTLASCPFNGFGTHNCVHGEDFGVTCM